MKQLLLIFVLTLVSHALSSQSISLLKDINPGSNSSFPSSKNPGIVLNDLFLFAVDGTQLLYDIYPGATGSGFQDFHLLNDLMVFTADHPN